MSTSRHQCQLDSCIPLEPLEIRFDFVVSEKSVYKPVSGSANRELSFILDHHTDGLILSEMNLGQGYYSYIVGWKDKPHLLVSVRPQKILDYVSARSYEEWHSRKMDEETKKLNTVQLMAYKNTAEVRPRSKTTKKRKRPLIKARKTLAMDHNVPVCEAPSQDTPISSASQSPVRTVCSWSPHQNLIRKEYDAEKRKCKEFRLHTDENGQLIDLVSPKFMPKSRVIQNKIDASAKNNSNGKNKNSSASPRSINYGQSVPSSPQIAIRKSLKIARTEPQTITPPLKLNRVNQHHLTNQIEPIHLRIEGRKDSVASISSLEAGTIYEALEMNHKKAMEMENQAIIDNYLGVNPSDSASCENNVIEISESDTEDQSELEVEGIQDEKLERDKQGNLVTYYLIKWKGDYTDTWEPEENIGSDILSDYTAKKKASIATSYRPQSTLDSELLEEFCSDSKDIHQLKTNHTNRRVDTEKITRKAKQKAMSINMSEPGIMLKKRGGIPGDLGDEDEPFQETSIRRRKSNIRPGARTRSKSLSHSRVWNDF